MQYGFYGPAFGEKDLLPQDGIHGKQKRVANLCFGNVALHADLLCLFNELVAFMHGENQYGHLRQSFANLARRFKSAEHRHGDIEDDQIGRQGHCFLDGFLAVDRFSTYFDICPGCKNGAYTSAHGFVIIGNQYAQVATLSPVLKYKDYLTNFQGFDKCFRSCGALTCT